MHDALRTALEADLESSVTQTESVGGTNHRCRLNDGRELFVKQVPHHPAGMITAEARGLLWLREVRGVPVVEPISWRDSGRDDSYLALSWIESSHTTQTHNIGAQLAKLHASLEKQFGLETDGFISDIRQVNHQNDSWPDFYGTQRLDPLFRKCFNDSLLPRDMMRPAVLLISRLPRFCGEPEPPSRIHGDLWFGNVITTSAGPVFIDPSPYAGCREMDLAMMRLFGHFSDRSYEEYNEIFPLTDGWERRVSLYQLYYLLVHVIKFGTAYVRQTIEAISEYV